MQGHAANLSRQPLAAIQSLAEHKPFFSGAISETLLASFLAQQVSNGVDLSHQERTMMQLFTEGHTNRQVGKILEINLKTVESRRAAIVRKLNLSSSAEMVLDAIRNGIIEP